MTSEREHHQWQIQELEMTIDRLEDEILELKGKLADQAWNPEEITPDDAKRLLVVTKDGVIVIGHFRHVYGEWYDSSNGEKIEITHWMPLPDPPQI